MFDLSTTCEQNKKEQQSELGTITIYKDSRCSTLRNQSK